MKLFNMKNTKLQLIDAKKLVTLKRNPQFMTPKQMDSLKTSMQRDGFVAPILVRPYKGKRFEVISGNHRFMAAVELGIKEIPCVISNMDDDSAKRLAVNLNTIHGEPNAELLAPFLADMGPSLLAQIHLEESQVDELVEFDKVLAANLSQLIAPSSINSDSPKSANKVCVCPKCQRKHFETQPGE